MSSTIESKSARDTREHPTNSRVSSFDVRPSVAGMIADSEGNLDEKKTVAALSQTHNANKYLWTGAFVLVGVVVVLIAANIGISVAVARLTRQLNVDPVTGMATIAGSDDVVMKTSIAQYKEEDFSFHNAPIEYLSAVKTVEFNDGNVSFDVKGYARMSNETILLIEGGALIFDIIGLKNITGEAPTQMMLSINDDMKSSDLHGRKLCASWDPFCQWMANYNAVVDRMTAAWGGGSPQSAPTRAPTRAPTSAPTRVIPCGPDGDDDTCPEDQPYCDEGEVECFTEWVQHFRDNFQPSFKYDFFPDPNGHNLDVCNMKLNPICENQPRDYDRVCLHSHICAERNPERPTCPPGWSGSAC